MTPMQNKTAIIHAGDVLIDLATREIRRRSVVCKLEPRAAAVLAALIASNGQVCERETLIDQCWTDDYGSDEALSQTIAQLRRALGDDFRQPRFIGTVHKSGYRWLAPKPVADALAKSRAPFIFRSRGAQIACASVGAIAAALFLTNPWRAPETKRLEIHKSVHWIGGRLHQTIELNGDPRAVEQESRRLESEKLHAAN